MMPQELLLGWPSESGGCSLRLRSRRRPGSSGYILRRLDAGQVATHEERHVSEGKVAVGLEQAERLLCKQGAAGSSPATSTNQLHFNKIAAEFFRRTTCC
jgi:hypothetical protein